MNLSDKIIDNVVYPKPLVEVSDLKQAVAELKKDLKIFFEVHDNDLDKIINHIFGDKLI